MDLIDKQVSVKKNVIMGIINAIINNLVPIVSFIYVSRKLGAAGLGINQFAQSLVNYFVLFSALGIPLYATKHIAKLRDNQEDFKKQCSEIFWLNMLTTFLATAVYIGFILMTDKTRTNIGIYLIWGLVILSNALSVEWFYQGTEKFTYITIRNFIVKFLTLITLFIFVKSPDDFLIYGVIMVASIFAYSVINFIKFYKEVKPSIKDLNIKRHIKSTLIVFALNITISLYVYLDNIMLGYMLGSNSDYAVGQYSVAIKIPRVLITIITTLNSILLPRLSYFYSTKEEEKVKNLLGKSFSILFSMSLATTVGLIMVADKIILLMSGAQYFECVPTARLACITIFFVVMTNLIGIQIFFNINKTWKTIVSCVVGAVVNIVMNAILIPKMSYFGAGIGTVCAEISVFVTQIMIGYKDLKFKIFTWDSTASIMSTILMFMALLVSRNLINISLLWDSILLVGIGVVTFGLGLLIFNHRYFKQVLKQIINKILKKEKKENV